MCLEERVGVFVRVVDSARVGAEDGTEGGTEDETEGGERKVSAERELR